MRRVDPHTPLVTVVMTCYNSSKTIARAIESVRQQLYKNIELIVVDDASTDETLKIVQDSKDIWRKETISGRKRILRIITSKKNYGTYICRNYAIRHSRGSYITFHDSDDISSPFYVLKLVNQLRKNRDAKISVCLTNGRASQSGRPTLCAVSTCFRSDLVKHLGYFDSVRFGADSEFRKRCEARYGDKSISIVNEKLYMTRSINDSLTSNIKTGVYSSIRKSYYSAFRKFHYTIMNSKAKKDLLRYHFPMKKRPFLVPTACGSINVNLGDFTELKRDFHKPLANSDLENKTLTVLMSAYKSQDFIEMSIWSVLDQDLPEGWKLELIVGVDGCDQTAAVIQGIKDPRLGIIQFHENNGTYKTFNSIFDISTGSLVMRFDSDDIMSEGLMHEMITMFVSNPDCHWAGTRCARINEHGRRIGHFNKDVIHVGQRMWRRETWVQRIGSYEPWVCAADAEVVARAELAHGIKCMPTKNSFLCYRKHSGSLVNSPKTNMRSKKRAEYHGIIKERKKRFSSGFMKSPIVPDISTNYTKSGLLFSQDASQAIVSSPPENILENISNVRKICWAWFDRVHRPHLKKSV